jgi:hypothetical protein
MRQECTRARRIMQQMAIAVAPPDAFQRVLLRRGVGALAQSREECIDCGRTPLTGERVHVYEGRRGGVVCELCRTLRREPPVATEIVRHCEHGHAVRLTVRVTRSDAREITPAV